jgi:hypothetical protein
MKILLFKGFGDYGVYEFENLSETPEEVAKLIESEDIERLSEIKEECDCEFEIVEFSGVILTEEFEDFIRNNIQDYEDSKHNNFYILKDV